MQWPQIVSLQAVNMKAAAGLPKISLYSCRCEEHVQMSFSVNTPKFGLYSAFPLQQVMQFFLREAAENGHI